MRPIAHVKNTRSTMEDDGWGGIISEIILEPPIPGESLEGLEGFSHAEIIFYFHHVKDEEIIFGERHPRDNPQLPSVGIFAQRGRVRPNKLGLTIVRVIRKANRSLFVEGLDAVDGTPVLDIKPVMKEFLPLEMVRQPKWSHDLLKDYWHTTK